MAFTFTEEQREFRAVLRRFFAETSPPLAVRRAMETELGFDPALWRRMAAELGLLGLHVPEAYGGAGFGFVELGIVLEELGRALVCAPYFSSVVLASTAILNGGTDDDRRGLLPALIAGEALATLAFAESSGSWEPEATTTAATPSRAGHFRLSGEKSFVLDGCAADLLIVLARAPGSAGAEGLSLFLVRADARGVERKSLQTLDPTRKLARVRFDDAEGVLLGELGGAVGPLRRTLAQAAAALANEMVGGAERLREDALDYAKLRVQFGRPLASFQAMKHKQADMLLEVEMAKSAAYRAAADANGDDGALFVTAALAKAVASEAYVQTAVHAVQIHGGIGFTWEAKTHLWFRRAKSSEVFLGEPNLHRERMLCAMGH
jgi:alkylation response protein AidB-like acyl-CoA dehydrogenase